MVTKKSRRLKRLRELARAAAEAEVERWIEDETQNRGEDIVENVRRTLRATSSDPGPPAVQERLPEAPLEVERDPQSKRTESGRIKNVNLWRDKTSNSTYSKEPG